MGLYNGYHFSTRTNHGDEIYCDNCGCEIFSGHPVVDGGYKRFCSMRCAREYADMNPLTSSSSGCFITTATCKSHNLPDDCHELTSLRAFRDNFMKKDEKMMAEVMEYYEIAPKICSNIDKLENSSEIYDSIWSEYLRDAVDSVDAGENQKAYEIYKNMVFDLKKRFLEEENV